MAGPETSTRTPDQLAAHLRESLAALDLVEHRAAPESRARAGIDQLATELRGRISRISSPVAGQGGSVRPGDRAGIAGSGSTKTPPFSLPTPPTPTRGHPSMSTATLPHQDRRNTRNERHNYDFGRVLRAGIVGQKLDGLEAEVQAELRREGGYSKATGVFVVPIDAPVSIRSRPERRDLTATSGAGLIGDRRRTPWIEAFRSKLLVQQLGAEFITGLVDDGTIPRFGAGATVEWLAAGAAPTEAAPEIGTTALSMKRLRGFVDYDRGWLASCGEGAEAQVMGDIVQAAAAALDVAAINGPGTLAPVGVLQHDDVPEIALGANGALPTWEPLAACVKALGEADGDRGRLAWVTSPAGRYTLQVTQRATGGGLFLWDDLTNSIAGFPAFSTTAVPKNLTKGSGTALTALLFGDFTDMVIGQWGQAFELLINPYSFDTIDVVRISVRLRADVALKHPADSWVRIVDMIQAA